MENVRKQARRTGDAQRTPMWQIIASRNHGLVAGTVRGHALSIYTPESSKKESKKKKNINTRWSSEYTVCRAWVAMHGSSVKRARTTTQVKIGGQALKRFARISDESSLAGLFLHRTEYKKQNAPAR